MTDDDIAALKATAQVALSLSPDATTRMAFDPAMTFSLSLPNGGSIRYLPPITEVDGGSELVAQE